jgi:flavin-dependent thymidylate synthase
MKNIKVELLHYTPMTVLLKALSMPYKNEKVDMSLAEKVCKVLKHESVAEHVYMNFLIDGVSRAELQEHMRHRISSTTCESTRYTLQELLETLNDLDNDKDFFEKCDFFNYNVFDHYFVTPEYVESKWKDVKLIDGVDNQYQMYLKFIDGLNYLYEAHSDFMQRWYNLGVKNDYLKYALQEGYRTRFVWTLNVRSLNNFLSLRDSKNAHFEIAYVAGLIRETLKNTFIERILI